jgi:hypothetical protein
MMSAPAGRDGVTPEGFRLRTFQPQPWVASIRHAHGTLRLPYFFCLRWFALNSTAESIQKRTGGLMAAAMGFVIVSDVGAAIRTRVPGAGLATTGLAAMRVDASMFDSPIDWLGAMADHCHECVARDCKAEEGHAADAVDYPLTVGEQRKSIPYSPAIAATRDELTAPPFSVWRTQMRLGFLASDINEHMA